MNSNGIMDLRKRLSKNLRRLINNPVIEAKELAAFDLIMSRRQFLKSAQLTAIGALVASAYPPTAWGKVFDDCQFVKPGDVGLTPAEMATVTQASGIDFGTELFQDTIYAEPVVAPDQPYMHGLIEGPRSRMRVQSLIGDQTPLEETFFDSGFHFGRSELIQLEQSSRGAWQVVHYFHPWNARTDGGRTDGLIRHVILTFLLGVPTRIFCITGSHTNEFITTAQGQQVAASYLVYVEINNGKDAGYIAIGHALSSVESGEVTDASEYPLTWDITDTGDLDLPPGTSDYRFADKYVNAGLDLAVPGDYAPVQATEHIIIYLDNRIKIISLDDITTPGKPILIVTSVPFPDGVTDIPRIAHIEFNPVAPGTGEFLQLSDFALVSPANENGAYFINIYSNQSRNATIRSSGYKSFQSGNLKWLDVTYSSSDYTEFKREFSSSPSNDNRPDYSTLKNVNGLASTVVSETSGSLYTETVHLKIGNFPGTDSTNNLGLCLYVLDRVVGDDFGADPDLVRYILWGDFPLAVPDDAGIGTITGISGGISKFGGLRLFAGDDIGNLFMLRQQRLYDSATPYTPPIYIQNDAEGNPATFSTTQAMALPSSTADSSNLQGFDQWMYEFYDEKSTVSDQTSAGVVAYNFLLSGALGFGTDDTNVAQATWLGSGYQAVYAPKRFAHDSEHMVVRQITDNGTTSQYNVLNVFNNIVEKTWVSRLIASQVDPSAPGLQESGDFYQASLYATNIYGDQVALNDTTNPGMMIEICGDAPVTVIDLTNNKYYDVDRYTSFVALPDQTSNQLRVAVKAENFSQIIYARLLQTDELSPSSSDSAMLNADTTSVGTATDWVAINIAADGQARMAASDTMTSLTSGSCGSGCADQVYVCADSLCQSNADNNWQTKGGYSPSTGNLDSLSSYLNQSGQNLSDASANAANLTLGATTVDPLTSTTSLTADASRTPLSTTFDYQNGEILIDTGVTASALPGAQPGSAFSSLNHALHDAFHWLQHVEGKLYSDLNNGVNIAIDDTENITVTVSADIMKQVNGIDTELQQVVSTVEEYGSIVVNVVVTIVESSFIYRFIELLIALISLFIYLEDIKKLSDSLKSLIKGLPDPSSTIPLAPVDTSYPWQDKLTGYVGSSNDVDSDMNQANIDSVVDEVVDGLLNAVLKNPFTKKLLDEVVSAISRAISALDTTSPVQFNMDTTIVDEQIQLVEDFSADIGSLFVNVTDDAVNFLINQVLDDVENPQQSFTNFASGLGQFMAQVDADAMDAVYTALGQLTATDTNLIDEMMTQSDFLELHIPLLADLFKLFGLGSVSGNTVTVGAGDAISFPLALIIWTGIFMNTGKSISDINALIPASPTALGDPLLGSSTNDKLTFANAIVAADLMTINGAIWTSMQTYNSNERMSEPFKSLNLVGDLTNLCRWLMASVTTSIQLATNQTSVTWTKGYLPVFTYCRLVTAVTSLVTKLKSITISPISFPALNSYLNLLAVVWSVVDATGAEPQGADWAVLVGNDVGRAGAFGKLLYAILYGDNPESGVDSLPWYGAYVIGTAFGGFGAAAAATGAEKLNAPVSGYRLPSPYAIKQLLYQVDGLNIKLPKRAKCKQKTRLIRDLRRALLAYTQGDLQKSVFYLVKARRTVESLKYGRRITATDANLLITQIQNILTYIGGTGGKIFKGGGSPIDSRAYHHRRRPRYRGR
jgi:hypothetical protein